MGLSFSFSFFNFSLFATFLHPLKGPFRLDGIRCLIVAALTYFRYSLSCELIWFFLRAAASLADALLAAALLAAALLAAALLAFALLLAVFIIRVYLVFRACLFSVVNFRLPNIPSFLYSVRNSGLLFGRSNRRLAKFLSLCCSAALLADFFWVAASLAVVFLAASYALIFLRRALNSGWF